MAVNHHKRLSKGRQKIDIKKIDNKNRLHVTFSKRRTGLFKKAAELHLLTGAEIAVIVQSPANKIYVFGSPSADSVIHRYENEVTSVNNDPSFCNPLLQESHVDNNVQRQPDLEVVGMFGSKKEERKTIENKVSMAVNCGNDDDGDLSWFEELVDLENIYMFGIPGVNNDASFSNSLLQESEDDDNNIKHQHNGEVMGMFGPKNEEGKSIENKDSVAVSGGNDDDELSWFEELVDMEVSNNPTFSNPLQQESEVDHNIQHRHNVEVMGMFGDEKSIENKVPMVVSGGGLNWFGEEADAAAMGLEEAEKYLSALETLRDNLLSQANWLALSRDLQQPQPQCMHYQGIWSTERFFNGSWG